MYARLSLTAFVATLLSTSVCADTIWLKDSDDRITGTVKLIDSGKVSITTTYAGTINIDLDKVASIETSQELNIRPKNNATEISSQLRPAAEPGDVRIGEVDIKATDIETAMLPKPPVDPNKTFWKGRTSLSGDWRRAEKDVDSYDFTIDLEARRGIWKHAIAGNYSFEKKNGDKTTDRYDLSYSLSRFITEKLYWENKAKYVKDQVQDLRTQETIGTGIGYQLWDNELGAFSVSSLYNLNWYEFQDGTKENFQSIGATWNYNRYLWSKDFEVFTKGDISAPLASQVDYTMDADAGVRYNITQWVNLSLKGQWHKVSSKYGDVNERRILFGIGANW
ncbi:DUF481 domain-containing protein [Pseudomonas sp. F1_0610]|uniref:DUF481 domain-containing protein n=1 Tax=Pseudomonas sp. F1_0610 TaxID=3114284 RepID=UPI0039C07EC2